MAKSSNDVVRIGDWCVDLASGQISRRGESIRLEARAMLLLLSLAERQGEVVSIDELLAKVWAGVNVSQDSVYQAVTSLRRQLGDDAKQPKYIETVPRLGYRMVAAVSPRETKQTGASLPVPLLKTGLFWPTIILVSFTMVVAFFFRGPIVRHFRPKAQVAAPAAARAEEKSIAVVPFLDLTEGMKEEPFADGMTEELIDKLSKIPGFKVAPATSSFYFKGRQVPVTEIAMSLGAAYVLDGSVRKSGGMVRVAARLTRADGGFVVWSETYDRRFEDLVMVQDDIASEVAKALRHSIGAG
jgi:TolB-like protein/DNA-binding winged helix-turn-helix (wHTH) protein